jgi:hypothetical protein
MGMCERCKRMFIDAELRVSLRGRTKGKTYCAKHRPKG